MISRLKPENSKNKTFFVSSGNFETLIDGEDPLDASKKALNHVLNKFGEENVELGIVFFCTPVIDLFTEEKDLQDNLFLLKTSECLKALGMDDAAEQFEKIINDILS